MDASHLDRRAVEVLFGVQERRRPSAHGGLPGLQAGNAFAVERLALLNRRNLCQRAFQWGSELALPWRMTNAPAVCCRDETCSFLPHLTFVSAVSPVCPAISR